jgi:thioredoxin reductase
LKTQLTQQEAVGGLTNGSRDASDIRILQTGRGELSAKSAEALAKRGIEQTTGAGVWIAGDLRPMTQQVSVGMGTGNIAAVMLDQSLRRRDVRTEP